MYQTRSLTESKQKPKKTQKWIFHLYVKGVDQESLEKPWGLEEKEFESNRCIGVS